MLPQSSLHAVLNCVKLLHKQLQ